MGTDIHGYVEINCQNLTEECYWHKVIELGIVLERNYEMFAHLFGVRNESGINGIAANRGIPADTSNPEEFGPVSSGLWAHSWVTCSEILVFIDNFPKDQIPQGWSFAFEGMRHLSNVWGSDYVRMVVEFDN